jgi:alanine-synthesizing transaminase
VSFNVPYRNHFRITTLPDSTTLQTVFERMEELLDTYAAAAPKGDSARVLDAQNRFK